MQKIDKNYDEILSTKYKTWVDNLEKNKKKHPESRTYYDDVVMDLYRCQKGVCAYTEMFICPEKYFDYDENTHRFVPNTDIEDEVKRTEIQRMIDEVLFLNHGVVKNERENFVNELKQKIKFGTTPKIDRFFTAIKMCDIIL